MAAGPWMPPGGAPVAPGGDWITGLSVFLAVLSAIALLAMLFYAFTEPPEGPAPPSPPRDDGPRGNPPPRRPKPLSGGTVDWDNELRRLTRDELAGV